MENDYFAFPDFPVDPTLDNIMEMLSDEKRCNEFKLADGGRQLAPVGVGVASAWLMPGGPAACVGAQVLERDGENDDDQSSGGTATATAATYGRSGDRSRTLVAERRRRGRMKEKLYALRSLVPYITKMDKASIVGDAVEYVQDLQKQAMKLRAEIEDLQSYSEAGLASLGGFVDKPKLTHQEITPTKTILQMDAFQVEERGFYVRAVCLEGEGVAVGLYRAMESLTCLNIQTSNLATLPHRLIITVTLSAKEGVEEIDALTLKLWVMTALLDQGFVFDIQIL